MGNNQSKKEAEIKAWWKETNGGSMPRKTVTIEQVARMAQVGDLIICMGSGVSSCFIACNSPFKDTSHVMVVVPGPKKDKLCLSDAYEENTGTPCYQSHGNNPIGVQFVEIAERLRNYSSGKLIWRQRNRQAPVDPVMIDLFRQEIESWTPKTVPGYFKRWFCCDFVEVGSRRNDDFDVHTDPTGKDGKRKYFVCTTWAAYALQRMGMLDERLDPGDFNLGDFASTTTPVFGSRASYGPFIHINTLGNKTL